MYAFASAKKVLALTLAGGLFACASGGGDDVASAGKTQEAVVTIGGTNAAGIDALMLAVKDVSVTADGAHVSAQVTAAALEVSAGSKARALSFAVPEGAENVRITLTFDDFGGYETAGGEAGALDARGTRISMSVPAAALRESGAIALSMDLGRSLVAENAEGRVFTPHYQVAY